MFPIRDARGRTTGFSGREMDGSQPKYMNSPQTAIFDKSGTIYGIDMAASAIRTKDMAVIVEGYMDVIMAHQYGFNNVVASMGTAITEKHISILKKLTKNIALALDPDAAGEEAMLRCVEYENTLNTEVKVIILPPHEDPDEVIKADPKVWETAVAKAIAVIDYTIDMTVSRQDMSTASAKSQVANSLLAIIAKVGDDIRRDHYLTKLSKLAGISYNKLEGVLKTYLKPKLQKRGIESAATSLLTTSSPREEYCLALLVQHPELKKQDEGLNPDYFQSIVNREIYCACLETDDTIALKERLEPLVREKLENITAKQIPAERVAARFTECALALRRAFLMNQEAMRAEVFAMVEAESAGTGAALARLQEEGIEPSIQLKDVFARKPRVIRRAGNGRNK
jgi:DNA primase